MCTVCVCVCMAGLFIAATSIILSRYRAYVYTVFFMCLRGVRGGRGERGSEDRRTETFGEGKGEGHKERKRRKRRGKWLFN